MAVITERILQKKATGALLKRLHLKNCSYTHKGKKYSNYAIAESYRENGKSQKRILKYLNGLTEPEVQSYKNMIRALNDGSASFCNVDQLEFAAKKDFLNVSVLLEIWNQLGLSKVFQSPPTQKEVSTEQMAITLTLSRLLNPSSGFQTIAWFKGTLLPELLGVEASKYNMIRIFRELSQIHRRKESIEDYLFKRASRLDDGGFQIYFVDGTTTFFEGRKCLLAKPGKDKSHGYKSHTIVIVLMTDRQGYPVAWDVLKGSSAESEAFRTLADRMKKRVQFSDITFCFDRGFANKQNFTKITGEMKCHFISGIDQDQIKPIFNAEIFATTTRDLLLKRSTEISKETKQSPLPSRKLPIDGFYTTDGNRFYRELGKVKKYRYVVGFNVEIFKAKITAREEAIDEILLTIHNINQEQLSAKKDREEDPIFKKVERLLEAKKANRLIDFEIKPIVVNRDCNPIQAFRIEARVNLEEKILASHLDGIFVYITDHEETKPDGTFKVTAYDIVHHYKMKNRIEENFFGMKQLLELRPIYARLEKHVSGLVAIIVIAQFINVYIEKSLELGKVKISIQEFYRVLNASAPVALLRASGQEFQKLINTDPALKEALKALSLKNSFTRRLYNRPQL
jgi:transposase